MDLEIRTSVFRHAAKLGEEAEGKSSVNLCLLCSRPDDGLETMFAPTSDGWKQAHWNHSTLSMTFFSVELGEGFLTRCLYQLLSTAQKKPSVTPESGRGVVLKFDFAF